MRGGTRVRDIDQRREPPILRSKEQATVWLVQAPHQFRFEIGVAVRDDIDGHIGEPMGRAHRSALFVVDDLAVEILFGVFWLCPLRRRRHQLVREALDEVLAGDLLHKALLLLAPGRGGALGGVEPLTQTPRGTITVDARILNYRRRGPPSPTKPPNDAGRGDVRHRRDRDAHRENQHDAARLPEHPHQQQTDHPAGTRHLFHHERGIGRTPCHHCLKLIEGGNG